MASLETVSHSGQCHCGAIQFVAKGPSDIVVWHCNCSICAMKQNHHFVIPAANFTITNGFDCITEYRFNSKQARHQFCKHCGVQAFYIPRSNPDGVAITAACITSDTISSRQESHFDGQNWEAFIQDSSIQAHSKAPEGEGGGADSSTEASTAVESSVVPAPNSVT